MKRASRLYDYDRKFSASADRGCFHNKKHSTLDKNNYKIYKLFLGLYKPLELASIIIFKGMKRFDL